MIRELTVNEIEEVQGGVLPVVDFALAAAARVGVGSVVTNAAGHVAGGVSLGIATYSLANYMGSSAYS